ncbi:unnamed protein product [Penicillium salamii]|uniref:CENP-V/GFA domain-containing protein n=1 Tax=Penicillium salamii TaxID=1612424 RepID=A0A9W4I4D2_9EURO|nr:unnamed protein product [Penicillium salamii]CAG7955272.1 unnamed protein product [Penicillium salamii]CAG8220706.1 unnamed protein product [Penicillium salamii]CAG8237898.1 unnamed protein product [Penicillium salamii]CAG8295778.1 unnamed protein product [Penicillium salamii]
MITKMDYTNDTHSSERDTEVEDYTKRPPYLLQPSEEFGEIKWRAHCHCGLVRYALRRDRPLNAKFCHCRQCQVLHGAPFQWAAIFPKEDIRFEEGASCLSFYAARQKNNKYQTPTKVSCSFCRTPIMDEGRNMCLLFPQLIDFSDSPDEQRHRVQTFMPTCHIFYENRLRDINDSVTKWSGMDEQSQRLDDAGQLVEQ